MKANQSVTLGLAYVTLVAQTGCLENSGRAPESRKPKLVFITSGTNSFWQDAEPGIEAAARDFKAHFELITNSSTSLAEDESDGIAFSPINGAAQLITPGGRICFVGVDHYKAGRKAGLLIKEVAPEGGTILIISQTPDFAMSQERRRGIAHELATPNYLMMDTMSVIGPHIDGTVIVALSLRDAAVCLKELCARDKLSEVKLITFDNDATICEALSSGSIYATITAQPYQYGYHAVRVLAGLSRGDVSVLPRGAFLDLPLVVLGRETASHTAARNLHSAHDSTLFPRADAGNLDRAAEAGNLAAD